MYFHFSFIYFCSVQLELWQSNNMTEHHTGFHVLTQNVTTQAITSLWKRLVIIPVVIPVRWQQCHYTILEFIQHYSSQHVLVWFLWKQSLTVTQRGNSIKTVVGHIEVTLDLVCFVLSVIVYILHPTRFCYQVASNNGSPDTLLWAFLVTGSFARLPWLKLGVELTENRYIAMPC